MSELLVLASLKAYAAVAGAALIGGVVLWAFFGSKAEAVAKADVSKAEGAVKAEVKKL